MHHVVGSRQIDSRVTGLIGILATRLIASELNTASHGVERSAINTFTWAEYTFALLVAPERPDTTAEICG